MIVQALKEKFPTADPVRVMTAIMSHFASVGEADTTVVRGWCFEAMREMYQRMVDIGDYANAMRAIKELNALTKA